MNIRTLVREREGSGVELVAIEDGKSRVLVTAKAEEPDLSLAVELALRCLGDAYVKEKTR